MKKLLQILAGITVLTLMILPVTGVFAACPNPPACPAPNVTATTNTPGCDANCMPTPALGTSGGTSGGGSGPIGGKNAAVLPDFNADDMMSLITNIVNWVFSFLMLVVVVMVLVAGYMFVTGGSNPEQVGKARSILMYSLIGFAIAMLARGIIALVIAFIGDKAKGVIFPFK